MIGFNVKECRCNIECLFVIYVSEEGLSNRGFEVVRLNTYTTVSVSMLALWPVSAVLQYWLYKHCFLFVFGMVVWDTAIYFYVVFLHTIQGIMVHRSRYTICCYIMSCLEWLFGNFVMYCWLLSPALAWELYNQEK